MSAEKIIYNVLTSDVNLLAEIPVDRMCAGTMPIGTTLPAITYSHISTVESTFIQLETETHRSRVQITVAAESYSDIKRVMDLVIQACNNKRGVFNGVQTNSIILDMVGSDFRSDDVSLYYQTVDFRLSWQ